MRRLILALSLLPFAAASTALFADSIPYGNVGTPATYAPIYATSTGVVTLYYVPAGATGGLDTLRFRDLTTGFVSGYFFPNQNNTPAGATMSFAVTAGDQLAFDVHNDVFTLSTNPALNSDGLTHGYVASTTGGTLLLNSFIYPAGLFVGMEDLSTNAVFTPDYNYNDLAFLVTNANVRSAVTSPVPEPGTLSLLATGVLGAAGFARRKFQNR